VEVTGFTQALSGSLLNMLENACHEHTLGWRQ
jgi:hypothetical protein